MLFPRVLGPMLQFSPFDLFMELLPFLFFLGGGAFECEYTRQELQKALEGGEMKKEEGDMWGEERKDGGGESNRKRVREKRKEESGEDEEKRWRGREKG